LDGQELAEVLAGAAPSRTLDLRGEDTRVRTARLTIGPQGRVQADLRAREIIIEGTVHGNLRAYDRLQIRRSGSVTGDLITARIVIEDGAYFKGSIDIQKPEDAKARRVDSAADSFRIRPAPVVLEAREKLE
jgi:cytoskeletal protein CcmA (bactofilin family)